MKIFIKNLERVKTLILILEELLSHIYQCDNIEELQQQIQKTSECNVVECND
jgi:hypothetical protein